MPRRKVQTQGLTQWKESADLLLERFMRATEKAVDEGLGMIERQGRRELSRKSHAPGTRTPSLPGEPPAMITEKMRDRWRRRAAHRVRRWRVAGEIGNATAQSRIQEKGGRAGAGHRAKLPPRPYLAPAVRAKRDDIHRAFRRRYEVVILKTNL